LVFITKYRRGTFDDAMPTHCEQVMRDVCTDFDAELHEFNGEPDHVHLLIHHPPTIALSRLVNSLEGVSSRHLRAEYVGRVDRANTRGAYGPRPASPHPAAEHPWRSSRSTSMDSKDQAKDAIPPGPEGPGFLARLR
jgi:REP element-mobilizing transposase RayT